MFTTTHPHRFNRPRTFLVRSSAICAVAMLAVACGGAEQEDSSETSSAGVEVDPLTAGLLGGKTFEEAELEVQQMTQACMNAFGWEYTAAAPSAPGGVGAGGDLDVDAFVDEFGYGVSTNNSENVQSTGGDDGSDPNAPYVNSLSESDRTAYYDDLFGKADADADPAAMAELGGCSGEANTAVYGEGSFAKLNDQLAEVDARMKTDQRMLDVQQKWSDCMSGAGYTYTNSMEPTDDFSNRLSALGSQPDPAALLSLQAEELATAKADRGCAKTVDLDTTTLDVFLEISTDVASGS